jgi:hypothetical protein
MSNGLIVQLELTRLEIRRVMDLCARALLKDIDHGMGDIELTETLNKMAHALAPEGKESDGPDKGT